MYIRDKCVHQIFPTYNFLNWNLIWIWNYNLYVKSIHNGTNLDR